MWNVDAPESALLSLHVQAIINCTVTPSMTFTKTSQKFGQWADSRANTVYGLGFATEQQLHQVTQSQLRLELLRIHFWNFISAVLSLFHCLKQCNHSSSFKKKFSDKFKEVKDAARLAREKSQDKELANTALTIAAPQVSSNRTCDHESRAISVGVRQDE